MFSDPCRPTALGILKRYPSAQAIAAAGVEAITTTLQELAPRHYGRKTAEQLVNLARESTSPGIAISARSSSLKILCDQLEHTQRNLAQLEEEIDKLLDADKGAKGLQSVPEFGRKMVAVFRAELGDITRGSREQIRWSPTPDSISRFGRVANGKERPSSPSEGAVDYVGSCI
jgi:hypothetical protein